MATLAVETTGDGPSVLLVHGGVGPELTWERQRALAERWRLVVPWRRGFGDSPGAERQDFEVDAEDLATLLPPAAHLVGFSYGGLGTTLLAGREAGQVLSLTLVEVPLYALAGDDPVVAEMRRLSDAFIAGRTGDSDPATDRRFLEVAGLGEGAAIDPAEVDRVMRLAAGLRPPIEAVPDVERIRGAGIPVLVVSGEHDAGVERMCDLAAGALGARREHCPGAGHAVPRAPGFNELLEGFLHDAESPRPPLPGRASG